MTQTGYIRHTGDGGPVYICIDCGDGFDTPLEQLEHRRDGECPGWGYSELYQIRASGDLDDYVDLGERLLGTGSLTPPGEEYHYVECGECGVEALPYDRSRSSQNTRGYRCKNCGTMY